jgi:hypothetical protein
MPTLAGDFAQAVGIGRIGRADHDDQIAIGGEFFHCILAILRGVADVVLLRAADVGEARASAPHHACRIVHRQCGLGDVGQLVRVAHLQAGDFSMRHPPDTCRVGDWPMVPSTSGWPLWPIMMISRPASRIFFTSTWTLVTRGQVASKHAGRVPRLPGGPTGGRRGRCRSASNLGRFLHFFDEHGALGFQVIDHELVVDHLVAHVDGCAEFLQGLFDDGDGAVDAGAETARDWRAG